jgi:Na+-transporting methylmalonyl-CoA/oxaloacetate decarboxylase gamma subunit
MSQETIQNIIYALEIMGKGMLSIFVVILLLTFIVILLGKVTNLSLYKKDEEANEE